MFRWFILAALIAGLPMPALAYIDPGTGSMLIQSLIAAVAAALVFGRTLWHRVKELIGRSRKKAEKSKS
jgi:hypothetical protein